MPVTGKMAFSEICPQMADLGYGQNGDFLGFARKIQSPVTGKTAISWDLPVKSSHPLRAKRRFLGICP